MKVLVACEESQEVVIAETAGQRWTEGRTMYEDLVKRLRAKADYMDNNGITLYATTPFYRECADAIEELSLIAESNERSAARWAETAGKAVEQIPRWIPVKERLPEERINPNTRDFEYVLCTTIWGDVRPFKYGAPIGSKDAHFWNGAGYVDAYVTHWMPLPQPPKGETE